MLRMRPDTTLLFAPDTTGTSRSAQGASEPDCVRDSQVSLVDSVEARVLPMNVEVSRTSLTMSHPVTRESPLRRTFNHTNSPALAMSHLRSPKRHCTSCGSHVQHKACSWSRSLDGVAKDGAAGFPSPPTGWPGSTETFPRLERSKTVPNKRTNSSNHIYVPYPNPILCPCHLFTSRYLIKDHGGKIRFS